MKKKAFVTTTLAAILAIGAPLHAGATLFQTAMPNTQQINQNVVQQQVSHIYETKAEVLAVNRDGDQIVSLFVKEHANNLSEILFKVSEDTILVDNEQGIPADSMKIAVGDLIYIYGSAAMTRSLPPQSNAYVVLTNLDKKAPARLVEASEVTIDERGNAFVVDAAGNYNIHIEAETSIFPYKTRQFVSIADIVKHSRILVWSEIMALSHPAMVPADQVMLLPGMAAGHQEVYQLDSETIYKNESGVLMVPVRSVAESFGYEVVWNQENRSVALFRGAQNVTLSIDSNSYGKQKMLVQLDTAPVIVNDRTYVPVEFLRELMDVNVEINDHEE